MALALRFTKENRRPIAGKIRGFHWNRISCSRSFAVDMFVYSSPLLLINLNDLREPFVSFIVYIYARAERNNKTNGSTVCFQWVLLLYFAFLWIWTASPPRDRIKCDMWNSFVLCVWIEISISNCLTFNANVGNCLWIVDER